MGKQEESIKTFKLGAGKYGPIDVVSALTKAASGTTSPQVSYATPAASAEHNTSNSSHSSSFSSSPFVQPATANKRDEFFASSPTSTHEPFEVDESIAQAGSELKNLGPKALEALVGVASKGMVQHGVGNANIDQQIALGYLQVNTGNYAAGVRIFSAMLQQNPKVVAAYLGRGTAYALSGDLESASKDFSAAISVDPKCVDAFKRRGQTRAARGQDAEGLKDFDMAISIQKDHEVYHQRGLIYYKQKNYKRALEDFVNASKFEHSNKMTWNYMGLCYNALGQCSDACESYLKALSLDPSFKEAFCNLGIACKDWGKADKALEYFEKALKVDATYVSSNHVRALTWFGLGRHDKAIEDFSAVLYRDTSHFEARWMRAVAHHDVGLFRKSIQDFDKALELKPDHFCWYQKQLALFYQHKLDTDFSDYSTRSFKDAVPTPELTFLFSQTSISLLIPCSKNFGARELIQANFPRSSKQRRSPSTRMLLMSCKRSPSGLSQRASC
jgi:tetratricopeptide (TPR) repeat protein